MDPLDDTADRALHDIDYILTDVDDTLTNGSRLGASTLHALERLQLAGIRVIPVTAASAGWCNQMAHMWPVDAVIAENGGLYFRRTAAGDVVKYRWSADDKLSCELHDLADKLMPAFRGLEMADDQPYRETCLAFRRTDDVDTDAAVVEMARSLGARATLNSMWIVCWLGEYDKLAMARRLFSEAYGLDLHHLSPHILFIGDSQNDEPMFRFFPVSVGVATVTAHPLQHWPRWITHGAGGEGFVELAERVMAARLRT